MSNTEQTPSNTSEAATRQTADDTWTINQKQLAFEDIRDGIRAWRVWHMLGMNEIRHRYRRSVIGPFWLTLTMGVQAAVIGLLFSYLFQSPIDRFVPFITISLVVWYFTMNTITDGASVYINSAGLIHQSRRPLSIYVFQNIWKNLVTSAHTIFVFFVVCILYSAYPSYDVVFVVPALLILVTNVIWASMFCAIVAARYRDVPMIIQNLFTVLFWATPVFYRPEQLGNSAIADIIRLNPLYHIIEIVRSPLLGVQTTATSWIIAVSTAIFGIVITFLLYARTRARIAYWI